MPKNALADLPEVFVTNAAIKTAVSRAVAKGTLRQIGSKLYTSNLVDAPEAIVRRHLWPLVASYLPGALIVDRTAIESRPAADGSIFVIADRKRDIELPGITIRSRKGAGPLDTDRPFVGGCSCHRPRGRGSTICRRRGVGLAKSAGRSHARNWKSDSTMWFVGEAATP